MRRIELMYDLLRASIEPCRFNWSDRGLQKALCAIIWGLRGSLHVTPDEVAVRLYMACPQLCAKHGLKTPMDAIHNVGYILHQMMKAKYTPTPEEPLITGGQLVHTKVTPYFLHYCQKGLWCPL